MKPKEPANILLIIYLVSVLLSIAVCYASSWYVWQSIYNK